MVQRVLGKSKMVPSCIALNKRLVLTFLIHEVPMLFEEIWIWNTDKYTISSCHYIKLIKLHLCVCVLHTIR